MPESETMLALAAFAAALLALCNSATLPHLPNFDVHPPALPPASAPLRPWLSPAFFPAAPEPSASMHEWFSAALSSIKSWALHLKPQRSVPHATRRSSERGDLPDLYWRFIPMFQAAVRPGDDALWHSPCWANVTASAEKSGAGITLTVTASHRIGSFDCHDSYLLATVEGFHLLELASDRAHTVDWSLDNATAADKTWIDRNGVRLFRFMDDISSTLDELLHTVGAMLRRLSAVHIYMAV